MSYQVIARKYRPQRFEDVVGQEHVTTTLANAIQQNRIAHAYLFCGPRGTGKTTIARIFAKCLNCTDGPSVKFPDDDPRCVEIAEGRSLDVLEIDGASNNGVEQVRDLRETCKYAPASSRFKIYIIDEVHMLSTAAFNALLKTLEEPPAHVKFMFATTDPEKVLATILSRCQRFDLRRIPAPLIIKHLQTIAQKEKVTIDDAALSGIARGADGCMRDAESTLDQLISFCGNKIQESDVLSMFGLTGRSQLMELARAILAGEAEPALKQLHALSQQGKDLGRLLSDLLNHFRNLLVRSIAGDDRSLLEVSDEEAAQLDEQTKLADGAALNRVLDVLTDAELRFRDAVSRSILLEVTVMKAIEARGAVSLDTVLKTLQGLREGGAGGGAAPSAPAAQPARASRPARKPSAERQPRTTKPAPAPPVPNAEPAVAPASDLEGLWVQVLEAVGRASKFSQTYLLQAHPVSLDKGVFTIGFDPEFEDQLGLVDNARTHDLLQTKLKELGHPNTQIKFVEAEAPEGRKPALPAAEPMSEAAEAPRTRAKPAEKATKTKPRQSAPPTLSQDDFKNDPLIQQALEMFKGTIVDVRG